MDKVSVIISTYNRYKYLLNAINSVKDQSYKNIEIVVVNDGSTENSYKNKIDGVIWIDLEKNSRYVLGYPCMSLVKNIGVKNSTGKYIAFLDDDDYWMPNKVEVQLEYMKSFNCKMASSEAYMGNGIFDKNKKYSLYMKEFALNYTLKQTKMNHIPKIFTREYILLNNTIIMSSTLMERQVFDKAGGWDETIPLGGKNGRYEDWELWKEILKYTNCAYVDIPLIYYDMNHGDGRDY
jgi:glycosyltransferase involved in cell wall biosynthesis